jgi:hypothetical protein
MTPVTFYRGNTQILTLKGLYSGGDETTGPMVFQNAATVTATLNDSNGNPQPGLSGATLAYVAGSDGWYQYTVPSSFNSAVGYNYTLMVDADIGIGHLHREYPANVEIATQ